MYNGYDFYFQDGSDLLLFPITPPSLNITVDSKNEVVTLINDGDVNILHAPKLVDFEFEARFPMRNYPYTKTFNSFQSYYDKFKELKEKKKSFRFIVARKTPNGASTWETNMLVSLENFTIKEDAKEGDDVLINFKLKQFKEYGVKSLPTAEKANDTTSTAEAPRATENKPSANTEPYTVKNGDTLWGIAKAKYQNGSKWTIIYNANKTAIEDDAKKHGKSSSSNGHWIWAGLKLTIPSA